MQKNKISTKYILLLVLSVVLIATILLVTKPKPSLEKRERPPLTVEVAKVEQVDIRPFHTVVGRVTAGRQIDIQFELPGIVSKRLVEPGQRVELGQNLLALENKDQKDQLQQADFSLTQEILAQKRDAKQLRLLNERIAIQKREVGRLSSLSQSSLASQSTLDQAKKALIQLSTERLQLTFLVDLSDKKIALAKAAKNAAQRMLAKTSLSAPFSGEVNLVEYDQGEKAIVGKRAIQLIDIEQFEVELQLRQSMMGAIQLGDTLTLTVNNKQIDGSITSLQKEPDPRTFTHAVSVRFNREEGIFPGQMARVDLPTKVIPAALTVPSKAILWGGGETALFLVEGGLLRKLTVQLGSEYQGRRVVQGAIMAGMRVVARDVDILVDGQSVVVSSP